MGPFRNALMMPYTQPQQRVYPTPPFVPNPQDNILTKPPAQGTGTLGFDTMDLSEHPLMNGQDLRRDGMPWGDADPVNKLFRWF